MKNTWCMVLLCNLLMLKSCVVQAADWQQELQTLREDVKVLQRQVYRGTERSEKAVSTSNGDVQVKIGQYDEDLRKITGRLDVLEHSIKQNNERIDKLNRDMEIRLKILEGRQVPASLSAPAPVLPTTYDAPMANSAARAVVGDSIQGDDLAPLGGEENSVNPENKPQAQTQPVALVEDNAPIINANDPATMYGNAMQAYNSGFYDEAELAFGDIVKQFPNHALAGNSQYWLGEVYTKQGDVNKAKAAFKDGYEKYKSGNKAPDSLYRLGVTLENAGDKQKACIVFMSFSDEFPKANAELTKKAQAAAAKLGCK